MGVHGCREDGVLEAPGPSGSPGAPNEALYRSLRRHKTRLNEYFPFKICKRGAYIIFHPTFKFDDEIRAGGGRSGVYIACSIAHCSVYCYIAL